VSRWPALRVNVARLRKFDALASGKRGIDVDHVVLSETVRASAMSITTAQIPDGTDICVEGTITPTVTGLEFRGTVRSLWTAECRRCVEHVEGAIDAAVHAIFVADPDLVEDSEADLYSIDGDHVDVGDVVFEELMLSLPLSALCEENCVGPDPERFPTIVEDEAPDEDVAIDPRWSVLSELTFDED
jgi:uncharacterized protein